jgi:hypothetical protein
MPRNRVRLTCRPLFVLIGAMFLVPAAVETQTGRVTLQGRVSETVTLSVPSNFTHGQNAEVVSSGNVVRITLTGADSENPVIRVPLLVRSNSSFKLTATVESPMASLSQLSVTDVHASGTLVSASAVSGLHIPEQTELKEARDLLLVSGPRVSLGGTLTSPNNALQITVLIGLQSQPTPAQPFHLTFAATAAPLTQ